MGFKMKGHTLPGINQKSEGKNMADGRAKSSTFQKAGKPTEAELIAQAEARFGEGVKVPQYNREETENAKHMYGDANMGNFQGKTWSELSPSQKKKEIEKSITASDKREARAKNKAGAPMKASPVAKKKFPDGTVDVSKKNTSKKKASKPKVFIDHEKIKRESLKNINSEKSNKNKTTVKKPSTKPVKRDVKVVNPTLVKGVDY
tara:strand:+ start:398 stop:1009 length:612 start_codon:yes stop_codon:yes gene_type:complete